MTTHKVYVDTENLSREQLEQLLIDKEEEIWTLKANVEFLHSCLDDREKSIEIMKEKYEKLKEFLDITVQTKNEKIRNLLDELEFYKKQYKHSMWED